jgi:hypothetical protein
LAVILQILYASSIAQMDTNICRACDAGTNTIVFDEMSCKQHMEHSQMQEPHMQKQMQASCIPLVLQKVRLNHAGSTLAQHLGMQMPT